MSSDDIAIRVDNLSKCYQIYAAPRDRLKQFVAPRLQRLAGRPPRRYFRELWALKEISFEIRKGETVGVIGRNGSGKSTLLQMIAGTLAPTSGSVTVDGRVAALLELGSGFNPEFTGRENIFISGAILGLTREEIRRQFDEIADFAGIGDFIDQPVKTYSSGMFVRLAFAVNFVSDPAIMIVDEALAVGDMAFQAKCMTALTRIQERNGTILLVSHDIGSVKSLCSRAIYLDQGAIRSIGAAPDVAEQYIRTVREEMNAEYRQFIQEPPTVKTRTVASEAQGRAPAPAASGVFKRSETFDRQVAAFRYGSGSVRISYVELLDENHAPLQSVEFNQAVTIRIFLAVLEKATISVNFGIFDDKRISITGCGFVQAGNDLLRAENGDTYIVDYSLRLPLQEGNYSVRAHVTSPSANEETAEFLDVVENAVTFNVARRKAGRVWSKVHLSPALHIVKGQLK